MYQKSGFTLIELLVVVLIIGILSAVALPQYEWTVEKSRAAEALAVLKTLRDAQEVYYMVNGAYASDFTALDVEVPESKYFNYVDGGVSVAAYHKTKPYLIAYRWQTGNNDSIVCGTDSSADIDWAKQMCQRLGADTSIGDRRWTIVK
ncbi:MAG: prepilin-type N-terminal cleavage/methylation domain-containing protein [Elusimicrobia bacterium]|nr:prepilin-type N-terminal cleavage/methylation domain-containing protein [Elusimicrobiota bacterium]MDY6039009.1 prepilin-type N-terminal cleavage/methylation domain-containing protein [Elusimicrobiaceae bacterium]